MVENNNDDDPKYICDEQLLHLMFTESKDLIKQNVNFVLYSYDKVWQSFYYLLVLMGVYGTVFIFIYTLCEDLDGSIIYITVPAIICILFFSIALCITLNGIFPKNSFFMIKPISIYKVIIDEKSGRKEVLKDLIIEYLIQCNKTMFELENINFCRKKIHYMILISVFNFSLLIACCIIYDYNILICILSLSFTISFVVYYIKYVKDEKENIKQIAKNLDIDEE